MILRDYEEKFRDYSSRYRAFIHDNMPDKVLKMAVKGAFDIKKDKEYYEFLESLDELDEENLCDILFHHAAQLNELKRRAKLFK